MHDVLSKSLGSGQRAEHRARHGDRIRELERPRQVAARRGLPLEDVAPEGCCAPRRRGRGP